jgi:hypothetical protein
MFVFYDVWLLIECRRGSRTNKSSLLVFGDVEIWLVQKRFAVDIDLARYHSMVVIVGIDFRKE